jgi:glycerophosphoryl diester phosphodiesterase
MPTPLTPSIIAHRGDMTHAPENTLVAFASAIAKGVDGVELDVHPTADGELVVHHFFGLGSTNNGTGLVGEHTLAELKQLDAGGWFAPQFAGERIPTLAEVFDLCKGKCRLEVDMKGSGFSFLHNVIREVVRFDLIEDVELTTAHYALLAHAKHINSLLRTGTFFYQPPEWMPLRLAQQHALDWAKLFDIQVLHLNLSLITETFVDSLHRARFIAYGSNLEAEEEMRLALGRGIDSFSTGNLEVAIQTRNHFLRAI